MSCGLWLTACAALLVLLPGCELARRLQALVQDGRLSGSGVVHAPVTAGSRTGEGDPLPGTDPDFGSGMDGVSPSGRGLRPLTRSRVGRRVRSRALTAIAAAVGAATGMVGGLMTAVLGAAVGASAAALASRAVLARSRVSRRDSAVRSLRTAVGELQAGATPAAALSAVAQVRGPLARQLAAMALALDRGGEPGRSWADHDGELAGVGLAVALAQRTGAPLAAVLTTVADDLSAVREQGRAADLALAGPKSSAVLMAGLPVLGVGLGTAMGADPVAFLLGSGPGRLVLCVGVSLDLLGVWWMSGLLTRARRT